jgi:uncharacterized membrane protein YbhN (UPF0104 family)
MNAERDDPPAGQRTSRLVPGSKTVMTLCGIGLLAGMIVWAGPVTLWDRLRSIDSASLFGAMVAIVGGTTLGAINSYLICGAAQVMGFAEFLRAFWVAWAVGLVLPGQVGDMLTLTQVLRRRGMPLSTSIARTSVDKIVSLLCSLLVASQVFRLGDSAVLRSLSLGAIVLTVGIVMFTAASLWLMLRVDGLGFKNRWVVGAIATAAEVARTVLTRPRVLLLNLLLSLVKIGLTGISYWLVLGGLGAAAPLLPNVTIAAISSGLVAYLPLSANGIGTVEMAGAGLFGEIGVSLPVVLSMYVLLRLANILLAWVPAALLMPDLLRHRRT